MKTLLLKDGRVINVTLGDIESLPTGVTSEVVAEDLVVGIGWEKTKDGYIDPSPPPSTPVSPLEVDMRRVKKALFRRGLKAQVESAIFAMSGKAGEEAFIDWDNATTLRRDNLLLQAIATGLGWSDEFVDELFEYALTLE